MPFLCEGICWLQTSDKNHSIKTDHGFFVNKNYGSEPQEKGERGLSFSLYCGPVKSSCRITTMVCVVPGIRSHNEPIVSLWLLKNAGDGRFAVVAVSAGHVLLSYREASPLYNQFSAGWAEGVFSCVVGDIPDIDIA